MTTRTGSRLTARERAASVAEATEAEELEGLTVLRGRPGGRGGSTCEGTSTSTSSAVGSAPATAFA